MTGASRAAGYKLIPRDVAEWVCENYTEDGQDIWMLAWANADAEQRLRMVRAARGDGNCS